MKNKIALFLHRMGISADLLTFLGLGLAALAGWLVFRGEFLPAAAALLSSGLVDMLDGAVARVSGKQSAFGGILDSSLDRYGDGFIFGGLLLYFSSLYRTDLMLLTMSAWMGAFNISYVRARAECEIDSCRVGFWERGERIGALTLGLAFNNPAAVVWILGVALHWTVLQRLCFAQKQAPNFFLKPVLRTAPAYWAKVAVIVAALIFVRLP